MEDASKQVRWRCASAPATDDTVRRTDAAGDAGVLSCFSLSLFCGHQPGTLNRERA